MSGLWDFLTGEDMALASITAQLAQADERLETAMALLGDWQALPMAEGDSALRSSTRAFLEGDAT